VELKVDNKSALAFMKNPIFHERNKHIHVQYHYVRQCVEEDSVLADFISTEDQLDDIGTKSLRHCHLDHFEGGGGDGASH
jgi:hypothetical protein